jgi:hypothetical protein
MSEKIGNQLAVQVANKLMNYSPFGYAHRDYCGTGFSYEAEVYRYGRIVDGYFDETLLQFKSRNEFINWLALQDNETLSGKEEEDFYYNNQRITRERLLLFVREKK